MIFELTGYGAFDGPVAGVVDARSDFIGDELIATLKKFDAKYTDVIEMVEEFLSDGLCLL